MGSSRVSKLKWLRLRRHVPVSMKSIIIYRFARIACLLSLQIAASLQPTGASTSTSAATNFVTGNNQKFISTPTKQKTTLGSAVQLICIVDHVRGLVQWTRDGFGLGDLDGYERYSMPGNKTNGNYSLVIHPVTIEDDAEFQCQVSSSASHRAHALRSPLAKLSVEIKPKPPVIVYEHGSTLEPIPILYQQLYAKLGEIVTLKCVSTGGRPAPKIKWADDLGNEINDGVTYASRAEGKFFNASSTLIFQAHEGMDNKMMSCQAYSAPAENIMNKYSMGCHVMFNIDHGDKSAGVVSANSTPSVVLWIGLGVAGILLILIFVLVAMIFRSNNNRESAAATGNRKEAGVVSVNGASISEPPHNVLDSSLYIEAAEARNDSSLDNYYSYPTPKTSPYKYSWDNSNHTNAGMGYNDNSYYVAVEDTEV